MSDLPKIVRARLQAQASPPDHLDPDVLTAFAEQALPAKDRDKVMSHLARCSDCREVVALSLPPEEIREPLRPMRGRSWFQLPMLRWGTAFAGVLIVAAVGIQLYRAPHTPSNMVAKMESPAQARSDNPSANESAAPASATQPVAPPTSLKDQAPLPKRETFTANVRRAVPAEPESVNAVSDGSFSPAAGAGSGAGRVSANAPEPAKVPQSPSGEPGTVPGSVAGALAKQVTASKPASMPPAASEVVEVNGAAPEIDTTQAQVQTQSQAFQAQRDDLRIAQNSEESDKILSRAKAAPTPGLAGRNLSSLVMFAKWTITSAGLLQRSFDQGKTWQTVDVTANLSSGKVAQMEAVSGTFEKRDEKVKATEKKSTPSSHVGLIFRAVSANGAEVWAGGSGGALYHSLDAGNSWTRIFPLYGSDLLTSDITGIQFSDTQHGSLSTATGETWTTQDAGLSWQRH